MRDCPTAKSAISIISCTSPYPSSLIFPISKETRRPNASLFFLKALPISLTKSPRIGAGTFRHSSKEEVAFESWAEQTANEYATEPKDEEDRREKLKVLNQIQRDPDLMSDPAMKAAVIKRRFELQRAKEEGVAFEDLKPYIEQHLKDGGDKETALETAIEQFNSKIPEEAQEEAEQINTELDRIKSLANLS